MKSPFTGGEVIRQTNQEELEFRNEKFIISYNNYKCVDTGKEFTNREIDELNIHLLHSAYRKKHNIPFPEEIIAIRERYGVSQTKMSAILGFGANTYRNYENGDIPQLASAKLISQASNPDTFIKLLKECDSLTDKNRTKYLQKAKKLLKTEIVATFSLFKNLEPDLTTGYRPPSFNKLAAMINYLAEDIEPFTTKLNKLLFYSDFLHFKNYGYSISGASYQAIQNGPVPHRYGTLYDFGSEKELFITETIPINDHEGLQFKPCQNIEITEFLSDNEIRSLETVKKVLGGIKTRELIDMSHEEEAWLANKEEKEIIGYNYAFSLKYPNV